MADSRWSILAACGLVTALSVGPSGAVTYVQMSDEALYGQADLVAEVVIIRELPELAGRAPATHYYATVEKVLKGRTSPSSIVLTSLGGSASDGSELVVPGAPRFEDGDRVVVFLVRDRDRRYALLHLGLGAFYKVGRDSNALAVRRLGGATYLDRDLAPAVEVVRNYDGFVDWLAGRRSGRIQEAEYFRTRTPMAVQPYRLVQVGGENVRWFVFDDGRTVNWSIRNTLSSNTQPQFIQAANVWSRAPVSLRLAASTNSTAGLMRSDNVNAIIFGDPNSTLPGTYSCTTGGFIGIVGFRFSQGTGPYEGRRYRPIREADIVINDGTDCLLNNNRLATAELFTVELGFSLGIDFSDKSNATMNANLHNDGRGAFLTADDIAALEFLYGKSSGETPDPPGPGPAPDKVTAPSNLIVKTPKAKLVRLRWKDNSKDETIFQIWRRIRDKNWKLWDTKPANRRSLKSKDVKPGFTYTFRVRAGRDGEFSEFSNEVKVTMPLDRLAAPSDLEVAASSATMGVLTWKDETKGEKLFQIERKEGDGTFSQWMTAAANATSLEFDDGTSGATYTFRIRAKKGSKVSDFSNEATVTMP